MFDIGWGELIVVGLIALIVIGPKELPTVMRTIGQWSGKIKRMASEFQGQFQEALHESELADLQKHAEDLKSSVNDITNFDLTAETPKEPELDEGGEPEKIEAATGSETVDDSADAVVDSATEPVTAAPTAPLTAEPGAPVAADASALEQPAPVAETLTPVEPPPKPAGGTA